MANTTALTTSVLSNFTSCLGACSKLYKEGRQCQCYSGCHHNNDCCNDYVKHCIGMEPLEDKERAALHSYAAFSVFYSIIILILMTVILCWAFYSLFGHCKTHGHRSSLPSTAVTLRDNNTLISVSFIALTFYVLSMFCYFIANCALSDEHDEQDVYGTSQIASLIFWFFGHSALYLMFLMKLYYFMRDTTYAMAMKNQLWIFIVLTALYLVSIIVTIVFIDEFHNDYDWDSGNNDTIIATMIIAFIAHVWFCGSMLVLFSSVLYKVNLNKTSTLIGSRIADDDDDDDDEDGQDQLKNKDINDVQSYFTRVSVCCIMALGVNVFCMIIWICFVSNPDAPDSFLRFSWWLYPIDIFFSFLCVFLNLNFAQNFNDFYKKLCVCPHSIFMFYCAKVTDGKTGNHPGNDKQEYGNDNNSFKNNNDDDDESDDNTAIKLRPRRKKREQMHQVKDDEDDDSDDQDGDGGMDTNETTRMNSL